MRVERGSPCSLVRINTEVRDLGMVPPPCLQVPSRRRTRHLSALRYTRSSSYLRFSGGLSGQVSAKGEGHPGTSNVCQLRGSSISIRIWVVCSVLRLFSLWRIQRPTYLHISSPISWTCYDRCICRGACGPTSDPQCTCPEISLPIWSPSRLIHRSQFQEQ